MAIQMGTALRDAIIAATETSIGTAPRVLLYTATIPADCQAAISTQTLLCNIALASDWFTSSAKGTMTLAATATATAGAAGTAAFYRLMNNGTTVTNEQGTVTATGGGGDLTLNNVVIASDQVVTITAWTRSVGNA